MYRYKKKVLSKKLGSNVTAWWPNLVRDYDIYTANCRTCYTTKKKYDKAPGLLYPLELPFRV